ncbi:hypothetical protein Zm00014a_007452 [Zea mays]|uniref:WW domain-containing protein n=1 Tax=Zea mays TaxID=4577 RepID=A0A3L6FEE8_MAIZE|nr:hypothetical protein Zm00014a_007452 [Zea mays]
MTTEFLRVKKFHQDEAARSRRLIELQPELSLGPVWPGLATGGGLAAKSSSIESHGSPRKKRKNYTAASWDWEVHQQPPASLDLQLNHPLPLDWEQCLDLQSGRMYYLNRKTLKKSWVRPREQNVDLNISTAPDEDEPGKPAGTLFSGGNMVAVPCANCHLLVMLCMSSPSCPNCKFVQPLPPSVVPPAGAEPGLRYKGAGQFINTI